jgi:Spy/CpxP family protein refolding chaperone
MKRTTTIALLVLSLPLLAVSEQASPYVGQQAREIKSMSADEIRGYLNGEGLGFAKAGELNHYPGPKHVLAMADHLDLSADQRIRIQAIAEAMGAAAVPLGRAIVDAERTLNARFANGTIDDASLESLTARIASLQGRLRHVHLSAHLATRAVLSANQITKYDQMRGYGGDAPTHHHAE